MGLRDVLYTAYAGRVRRHLDPDQTPRHVGVILDGNRRWATVKGSSSETGHLPAPPGSLSSSPGATRPASRS